MGEGNCAARGGQSAAAGAAAGPASDGISAARVAGAAEDSAGQHANVYASGAGAGESKVSAGGGEGVRHESGFDCGALPPRHSRGRQPGRVSLGTIAEGAVVGARAGRELSEPGTGNYAVIGEV